MHNNGFFFHDPEVDRLLFAFVTLRESILKNHSIESILKNHSIGVDKCLLNDVAKSVTRETPESSSSVVCPN